MTGGGGTFVANLEHESPAANGGVPFWCFQRSNSFGVVDTWMNPTLNGNR